MPDIGRPPAGGYSDDQGGNSIKLKLVGKDTNVNSVWDSSIIDHGATEHDWSKLAAHWHAILGRCPSRRLFLIIALV